MFFGGKVVALAQVFNTNFRISWPQDIVTLQTNWTVGGGVSDLFINVLIIFNNYFTYLVVYNYFIYNILN